MTIPVQAGSGASWSAERPLGLAQGHGSSSGSQWTSVGPSCCPLLPGRPLLPVEQNINKPEPWNLQYITVHTLIKVIITVY